MFRCLGACVLLLAAAYPALSFGSTTHLTSQQATSNSTTLQANHSSPSVPPNGTSPSTSNPFEAVKIGIRWYVFVLALPCLMAFAFTYYILLRWGEYCMAIGLTAFGLLALFILALPLLTLLTNSLAAIVCVSVAVFFLLCCLDRWVLLYGLHADRRNSKIKKQEEDNIRKEAEAKEAQKRAKEEWAAMDANVRKSLESRREAKARKDKSMAAGGKSKGNLKVNRSASKVSTVKSATGISKQ